MGRARGVTGGGKANVSGWQVVKLFAACLFCLFALPAAFPAMGRGNTSHFIDKLSCDSGPYGLKLPKTYDELRKIGALKGEKLLREQNLGAYKASYRDLVFNGLRLGVVTYSNDPGKYQVVSAEIRSPQWKIAGPFRQGHGLPPRICDVDTTALKSTSTVELRGKEDKVGGRRL